MRGSRGRVAPGGVWGSAPAYKCLRAAWPLAGFVAAPHTLNAVWAGAAEGFLIDGNVTVMLQMKYSDPLRVID